MFILFVKLTDSWNADGVLLDVVFICRILSVLNWTGSGSKCLLLLLFLQEAGGENAGPHASPEERKEKVPSPHLSQLVVLTASDTLYGLAERVVATESL